MARVKLRLLCCRCGRVQRFTARAHDAFSLADALMRQPCASKPAGRSARCDSRDLRLEVRPAS